MNLIVVKLSKIKIYVEMKNKNKFNQYNAQIIILNIVNINILKMSITNIITKMI